MTRTTSGNGRILRDQGDLDPGIAAAARRTVGEMMSVDPITVREDASIDTAVRLLEENDVTGLPVIDHEGLLVGVVSQSDIVRARAVAQLWSRWPGLKVRHLMHAPALTADPAMTMDEAATLMENARVHRLIVVGEDQATPIGVLSMTDLVRALAARPTDG
jgi:CBS domain-containing protein